MPIITLSDAVLIAIITSIATVIISWGSAILNSYLQFGREKKTRNREACISAYTSIMGQKRIVSQLYVSRFEAYIMSDYYEARWRLAGSPTDSFDFHEAVRWMKKSEDYVLEIANAISILFEAVGTARILFPQTKKLISVTDAVYRHRSLPLANRVKDITSLEELEIWKETAVQQVQVLVSENIGEPIDNLVEHLQEHLSKM